jgi:hypothetical protein
MRLLMIILFMGVMVHMQGQVKATTKEGKAVDLNNDGTWEYSEYPETNDTLAPHHVLCTCLFKYRKNEIDEYTGEIRKILKPVFIGTGDTRRKMNAYVAQIGGAYMIYLNFFSDLGCMNSDSYAIFTFEDNTSIRLKHTGITECGKVMYFVANVTPYIQEFSSKSVDRIDLTGSLYHSHITLEKRDYFKEAFNCCIF